ncbi:hypothetical protein ACQPYE_27025 [Actinosynnema sp. CA-299493]
MPEIFQCKRLGRRMAGVQGTYSHVTQVMVDAMLDRLQRRWERSLVAPTGPAGVTVSTVTPESLLRMCSYDSRTACR